RITAALPPYGRYEDPLLAATASKRVGEPIHHAQSNNKGSISRMASRGAQKRMNLRIETQQDREARQGVDAPQGRKRSSLKPLKRMIPFLIRYKGLVAGSLFSLVLAAVTTLAVPVAVRRMIDHGFSGDDAAFVNNYFVMLVLL